MSPVVQLSIIVPAYNSAAHLPSLLRSLPDAPGIEVIVVDDGSQDNTADICRSWVFDSASLTYVHIARSGPGAARQLGLERAQGRYVAFADADDETDARGLSRLLTLALEKDADVVIGDYTIYGDASPASDTPVGAAYPRRVSARRVLTTRAAIWGKLYRRDFLSSNKIGFQPLRCADDVIFSWATAAAKPSTWYVDHTCYFYRTPRQGQLTSDLSYVPDRMYALKLLLRLASSSDAEAKMLAIYAYVSGCAYISRTLPMQRRPAHIRQAVRGVIEVVTGIDTPGLTNQTSMTASNTGENASTR